jgi:hypothetical protein
VLLRLLSTGAHAACTIMLMLVMVIVVHDLLSFRPTHAFIMSETRVYVLLPWIHWKACVVYVALPHTSPEPHN